MTVSKSEFYQMMTVVWIFIGLLGAKQVNEQVPHPAYFLQHILPTSAIVMALISGVQAIRARPRT